MINAVDNAADYLVSAWEKLDAVGLDGLPPIERVAEAAGAALADAVRELAAARGIAESGRREDGD